MEWRVKNADSEDQGKENNERTGAAKKRKRKNRGDGWGHQFIYNMRRYQIGRRQYTIKKSKSLG